MKVCLITLNQSLSKRREPDLKDCYKIFISIKKIPNGIDFKWPLTLKNHYADA